MLHRFRKLPVEVDAVRWLGDRFAVRPESIPEWLQQASIKEPGTPGAVYMAGPADGSAVICIVEINGATVHARPGDWVIRGIHGEIYPCKDGIFRETYEAVQPELPGLPK